MAAGPVRKHVTEPGRLLVGNGEGSDLRMVNHQVLVNCAYLFFFSFLGDRK